MWLSVGERRRRRERASLGENQTRRCASTPQRLLFVLQFIARASQVQLQILRVVANNSALVRRNGEIGLIVIASSASKRLFLIAASFFHRARAFCASCKAYEERRADFMKRLVAKKRKVRKVRSFDFFFRRCRALFILYFAMNRS